MSVTQNFRRQARAQQSTVETYTAQPTDGAEERSKILETLPFVQENLVKTETFKDKTAVDTYLVFHVAPVGPITHRVAIETDTPPRCYVKKIRPLVSLGDHDPLQIPYYPIASFIKTYPSFESCIFSRVRYLEDNKHDRKKFVPGPNNKAMFPLDSFECLVQLLHGTMDKFWAKPSEKHAHNIWRVARTLQFHLASMKKDLRNESILQNVQEQYDNVLKLIERRDGSSSDALKYREGIRKIPVFSYYYILFQAMLLDCRVLHKSNFAQTDLLLGGLFLMNFLGKNEAVTYEGMEDSYLRILFERAVYTFKQKSFAEFVDKESLIRFLHEECATRFHGYLKYNAFFVEVYRRLFTVKPFYGSEFGDNTFDTLTKHQMTQTLMEIHRYVKELNGINVISHFIAPTSSSYLTDENIAEYIMTSCEMPASARKFSVLSTAMFTSSTKNASAILQCVERNLLGVQKAQKELEEASQRMKMYATPKDPHQLPRFLALFKQDMNSHSGCTFEAERFKTELVALIQNDAATTPHILNQLLLDMHKEPVQILGVRKIIRTAQYFRKEGGFVHDWLIAGHNHTHRGAPPHINKALVKNMLTLSTEEVKRNLDDISSELQQAEHDDHCTYEKFESALEKHMIRLSEYRAVLNQIAEECPICFEQVQLQVLHGEVRHQICVSCNQQLPVRVCPLCREPL